MKSVSIIAITSPQGGCGKSTIATNLALYFAKRSIRTMLIDFAGYGSFAPLLNLPTKSKGMSSLLLEMDSYEIQSKDGQPDLRDETWEGKRIFRESLLQHPTHRSLSILFSASALKMDRMLYEQARLIMELAKSEQPQIVMIDLPSDLHVRQVAALEMADQIIVPTFADIISGWKLMQFKEFVEFGGIDQHKISLVVNRMHRKSDFDSKEFSNEYSWQVLAEIPDFSERMLSFINQGIAIEDSNDRKIFASFRELGDQLLKKAGVIK